MKALSLILSYLPGVLMTVKAVETELADHPGATKKAVALGAIQAAAQVAGQTIPNAQVQAIGALTDGVVATLNASGVFQSSKK